MKRSALYFPFYSIRYFALILFVFLGPTFGFLELKAFHLFLAFILLCWLLLLLRNKKLARQDFLFLGIVFVSCSIYLVYAVAMNMITGRYIQYFYYYVVALLVFFFSSQAIKKSSNKNIYVFLQIYIFFNVFIAFCELILNLSIFSYYPFAGTDYQVGSSFWANVNTNVVVLMIASSTMFFIGYKRSALFNFLPIFTLAAAVDAKLCILGMIGQILFFLLYSNSRLRMWFFILSTLLLPLFYLAFTPYFNAASIAVIRGWELLSQPEVLQKIVSSGNLYSIAIRAYALSEMLRMLSDFEWYNWLFGGGFGSINVSFTNNKWGGEVNFFSPHFFYLEILVYGGFFYYFVLFNLMKVVHESVPWKAIIISLPLLGSVVAISSAVYFMPLYFYLAVISCWKVET